MLNHVITAIVKFVFLLVFPTLLTPAAFADASSTDHSNFYQSKSHHSISAESHANSYTITTEAELKEPAEAEAHLPLSYIANTNITIATSHEKAAQNSLDHPLAPVSFLAYLSLFSISPPTLSSFSQLIYTYK